MPALSLQQQQSISGMGEELDRDRPLFNQAIPVQVKYTDHDKVLSLTVRVLSGTRTAPPGSGGGQREAVLHVELTDELDPFFLYTLQVGEDDYHQLKHDQRLRVDFKAFPRQFIELLEGCAEHCSAAHTADTRSSSTQQRQGQSQGVFLARLEAPTGSSSSSSGHSHSLGSSSSSSSSNGFSTFSLVETNHFKELTHLSLRFRAGNDSAVKAYLAARLRQLRKEGAALSSQLSDTDCALTREKEAAAAALEEVEHLRSSRERDLRDLRAAHSAELTALREDAVRRAEATAAAAAADTKAAQRAAAEARSALDAKLAAAETARDAATSRRYTLEAELREVKSRGEAAAAAAASATQELTVLREANRKLETQTFEQEKEIQRLSMRGAALEQQVKDLRDIAAKSAALQEGAEGGRGQLAAALEAYRSNVLALQEKLEASVAEINRGNAIIQRIQAEHRALKAKTRLKTDVIKQQERLLSDHRDSLAQAKGSVAAAQAEAREADARAAQLKRELAAVEARAAEGARLIESNQQVITWLNKELNDANLGISSSGATAGAAHTIPNSAGKYSALQHTFNAEFMPIPAVPPTAYPYSYGTGDLTGTTGGSSSAQQRAAAAPSTAAPASSSTGSYGRPPLRNAYETPAAVRMSARTSNGVSSSNANYNSNSTSSAAAPAPAATSSSSGTTAAPTTASTVTYLTAGIKKETAGSKGGRAWFEGGTPEGRGNGRFAGSSSSAAAVVTPDENSGKRAVHHHDSAENGASLVTVM